MFWRKKDRPAPVTVGNGYTVHYRKKSLWKQFKPIVRVGIPFFSLIAIGTFLLYRVAEGRYEVRDRHGGSVSHSVNRKKEVKPFSLEEEYKKMQSQIDLSAWENKRIPRPNEEKE